MVKGYHRSLHLGVFFNHTGHHIASWRHPDADPTANQNIDHYLDLARKAEAACFDFIFFADASAVRDAPFDVLCRSAQYTAYFEPITLLTALAGVTTHIGLVSTCTTSFYEPYNVARLFASLDHISKGRAGWNVVTSGNLSAARNFGLDEHYPHDERYRRAKEFIEVVKGLWDSWDDDAFIRDRERGLFFDPKKVHVLDHKGKFYSVRGPLNAPRPPQGHPVIFQAGFSEAGRELAAATAEGVFTSGSTFEMQRSHYTDVKGRLSRYGRRPEDVRIMPGLTAIVGRTRKEADEKNAFLQSLIHPSVGVAYASQILEADLAGIDIDKPLPRLAETAQTSGQSRVIRQRAYDERMSLRQVYEKYAGSRGKLTMIGSVCEVADEIQRWVDEFACDGFIIQPTHLPGGLDEITQTLIPELQSRGVFRADYKGETLRENLGLKRPESRYSRT